MLQYDTLSGLVLPSKRAFDNMNKEFLEKRKVSLNTYLQVRTCQETINSLNSVYYTTYALIFRCSVTAFAKPLFILIQYDNVFFLYFAVNTLSFLN